ncbi:hypothetical protein WMW72_35070 [Paenibacillus filicis]|uniref:TM2 domain-containing protein n=1 Tax=Paenibacillus filicis TaxID=669464 RepID=A0ABU9DY87_9BACL
MNNFKSPTVAFLLSLIPGFGHLYIGRTLRGLIFGVVFGGAFLLSLLLGFSREIEYGLVVAAFGFLVWLVNIFDVVRSLNRLSSPYPGYGDPASWNRGYGPSGPPYTDEHVTGRERPSGPGGPYEPYRTPQGEYYPPYPGKDRYFTIFLSFLPGLGHFHLGLMQRGLAFLALFFGLGIITAFLTATTSRGGFMLLLGALPIIWLYSMFDCVQQLNKSARGERLVDQTFFEDFQQGRESGKKNKTLALVLSIFPGAGHMYLGLQKRGLQFMAAFLFSVYFLDALRLTLFLFFIPILWFYSFFDALQQISRSGREPLEDVPLVEWLAKRQRWVGYGLLVLGGYYLIDQFLMSALQLWLSREALHRVINWYHNYFQTFVVAALLIGGGFFLLRKAQKK